VVTTRRAPAATPPGRLPWRLGQVAGIIDETPRVKTLALDVPGWPGHRAGQHVDVRLTAEDGYQAQRSYSIASPPEEERVLLTVERLADGEVSPYLTGELQSGDQMELRGPIGGYFTWTAGQDGRLVLIAGGSGIVPLMAMLRHRARAGGEAPATLLYSSRSFTDIIYRSELDDLVAADPTLRVIHTLTREQPPDWTGYRRRIDIELLAERVGLPTLGTLEYVCGPTSLVENVATDLLALGYEAARVKTERFGPTGG